MATNGQRYAVDIGTGAASGAAAGTAILPGWGTAIGAGLGAIGGTVTAAVGNAQEAREKARLAAAQQRSRQSIYLDLISDYMAKHGQDTSYLDLQRRLNGEDLAERQQNADFAAQHRIDPMSFVPIAQYGAQAAGGLYKAANTPSASIAPQQSFQLQEPMSGAAPSSNYPELQLAPLQDPNAPERNNFQLRQPDFLRGLT